MKNMLKMIGIIAIVAMVWFTVVACEEECMNCNDSAHCGKLTCADTKGTGPCDC